jgi:hypothetical protein
MGKWLGNGRGIRELRLGRGIGVDDSPDEVRLDGDDVERAGVKSDGRGESRKEAVDGSKRYERDGEDDSEEESDDSDNVEGSDESGVSGEENRETGDDLFLGGVENIYAPGS